MIFLDLNDDIRKYMLDELDLDISLKRLYLSPRLNATGIANYEKLIRSAIQKGNDISLSQDLRGMFNESEQRRLKSGEVTNAKVPITAAETLSEGEFNRYYCRGVCRYAIEKGILEVEIYRAKEVLNPRPESQALIGAKINAKQLLQDLQINIGVDTALKVPAGPNSGLSVRLIK
jgi:hypothetical protein